MVRNKADRKPTCVSLVYAHLVAADDFCDMQTLIKVSGYSKHVTEVAIQHLVMHKAVDSVKGGDGKLWWFATPDTDNRACHVDLRVPEGPGTRPRRSRKIAP